MRGAQGKAFVNSNSVVLDVEHIHDCLDEGLSDRGAQGVSVSPQTTDPVLFALRQGEGRRPQRRFDVFTRMAARHQSIGKPWSHRL